MPPTRWTHTALHSWLVPHAMVRTIHGLGYPFQAHSPFFWSYALSIIQEQCHNLCIYIISIPCSGDYRLKLQCALYSMNSRFCVAIQLFLVLLFPACLFEREYYQKYCQQLT